MTALYLRCRPTTPDQLFGQGLIVPKLKKMIAKKEIPNVILLSGPTGTGKTTIARMLSSALGVEPAESNTNYVERNCADCRGIDDVREITDDMRLASLGGLARVWVLDEVVQLPTTTQQAMLKMLEDTPKHVYFFLCTSDTGKLLPTLKGRCYPLVLKAIAVADLKKLVEGVVAFKNRKITQKVIGKIAVLAEGSARMALQLLEAALSFDAEADQLASMEGVEGDTIAIDLARAVMYRKGWPEISSIISRLSVEPETVRRVMLKYCESVMLGDADFKAKARADVFIAFFRDAWQDCGRAGLITSCWRCHHSK